MTKIDIDFNNPIEVGIVILMLVAFAGMIIILRDFVLSSIS